MGRKQSSGRSESVILAVGVAASGSQAVSKVVLIVNVCVVADMLVVQRVRYRVQSVEAQAVCTCPNRQLPRKVIRNSKE